MQIHADVKKNCSYWPMLMGAMFNASPILAELKSSVATAAAFALALILGLAEAVFVVRLVFFFMGSLLAVVS